MAKAEWGIKRSCQECGTKFYDMRREPIVCPKCGAAFEPQASTKPRSRRVSPLEEEKRARKPQPAAIKEIKKKEEAPAEPEAEEEAEELKSEEEEEELIEDASELGEDEEDMAEVIEGMDEEDEPA